jgi:hypothetical protein
LNPLESANKLLTCEDEVRCVLHPGGEILHAYPLLWGSIGLPKEVIALHNQIYETPDLSISSFNQVAIYGRNWLKRTSNNEPILPDEAFPFYCKFYFDHNYDPSSSQDLSNILPIDTSICWSILNFNCQIYGHWLLEGFPKLLSVKEFVSSHPEAESIPLVLPDVFPKFIKGSIRTILPDIPILWYSPSTHYVNAAKLLLPSLGRHYIYNQQVNRYLDSFTSTFNVITNTPHIYVARRSKSVWRCMENASEIEDIARLNGFAIIYPEELTFKEQVEIFSSARIVTGEYCSALHNTLFSPAETKVLSLNWINSCQSAIAAFRQQLIGYQMPIGGIPVTNNNISQLISFCLDPRIFSKKLCQIMAMDSTS